METTRTIREHATHISLNIEYSDFKYEQNGAHHKTMNTGDEVYNDSFIIINLDIDEMQGFCNKTVCSHFVEGI
jgi:hypothetical protein